MTSSETKALMGDKGRRARRDFEILKSRLEPEPRKGELPLAYLQLELANGPGKEYARGRELDEEKIRDLGGIAEDLRYQVPDYSGYDSSKTVEDNFASLASSVPNLDFSGDRPTIDRIRLGENTIETFSREDYPWEGRDEKYICVRDDLEAARGIRQGVLDPGSIDSLAEATDQTSNIWYDREEEFGSEIKWGILDLEKKALEDYSELVAPEDFLDLPEIWSNQQEILSVEEARNKYGISLTEEEAVAAQLPENSGMFYMWDTGGTAEKYGLEKNPLEGGTSRGALYVRDNLPI